MKRPASQGVKPSVFCIQAPSLVLPASVVKSRARNGKVTLNILKKPAGVAALLPCQIYLKRDRVPFVFSRVKATKKKEAERCKAILIAKYEDQAWGEERLKREFLHLTSRLRK